MITHSHFIFTDFLEFIFLIFSQFLTSPLFYTPILASSFSSCSPTSFPFPSIPRLQQSLNRDFLFHARKNDRRLSFHHSFQTPPLSLSSDIFTKNSHTQCRNLESLSGKKERKKEKGNQGKPIRSVMELS